MYTEQEVKEIQDMISGKRRLHESEIAIVAAQFSGKDIPNYLYPFLGLFGTNPDLAIKVSEDEKVKKYSLFGFFPETFGLVYGSEISPQLELEGGNRGLVGIMKHPTKNLVIKPLQNSSEYGVVKVADELEVGPKQYTTLERFLTEQFIEGTLFSRLKGERASTDFMYTIGRRVGEIMKRLHTRDIFYNDTTLSDDFGRSHLIIPDGTSKAILFDYGVALMLSKHPNYSDEEVFNFARTLPMVNSFVEMGVNEQQMKKLIAQYRPIIQNLNKQEILERDLDMVMEGINFATFRIGKHIIDPFLRGFKEVYHS